MIFKQDPKTGTCDIVFSKEEIEIIQKKEKIHLSAESLRHFGNCLIRMVVEWNDNFGDGIKELPTNITSKVVGEDPDDKNRK
jgi:hypothetical protein